MSRINASLLVGLVLPLGPFSLGLAVYDTVPRTLPLAVVALWALRPARIGG
ncbi:hypothetical protein AAH979_41405 [Plantactinospora sp. ZYX-F-223]|uniref:hypothetical protein n=1 Tax=Plantactinospora sp. ZYX-F-223 TaxID=3144103 RepID=UPI0031FBF647